MQRVPALLLSLSMACVSEPPAKAPDTDTSTPPVDTLVETDVESTCPPDSLLTWETFGQGFMRTWCAPCHSSDLAAADRSGAPLTVDFDALEGVHAYLDGILETSTGEDRRMPPAGGVPEADTEALAEWLACGAPGAPREPEPCITRSWAAGDITLADPQDVDALCAEANAVEGELTLAGDVEVDCLCEITGGIVATEGVTSISMPLLSALGSGLDFSGHATLQSLSLPRLPATSGPVLLTDTAALTTLDLDNLLTIGGDLQVSRNATLQTLHLERLEAIRGDLNLTANPVLDTLWLRRVSEITGDLVAEDNVVLVSLDAFDALREVGGRVQITGNQALTTLDGFHALREVGEAISVRDNPVLEQILGFQGVENVGATIEIVANPALTGINAFTDLLTVRHGIQIAQNDVLIRIRGFTYLEEIGLLGDWRVGGHQLRVADNPQLTVWAGFGAVRRVGGIVVNANPLLATVDARFDALNVIARELQITNNPSLTSVTWMASPNSVGTDLTIEGNDLLPTADANALVQRIGRDNIWGEVTLRDNGP